MTSRLAVTRERTGWCCLRPLQRADIMEPAPLFRTRNLGSLTGWTRMATLDVHELEPLLRRALAGDSQALNDLFARLRKYMHSRVRKELGAGPDGRIDQSVIV